MRLHVSTTIGFVVGGSLLPSVLAWGAVGAHSIHCVRSSDAHIGIYLGHEVVATIAQIHLHPDVMPAICGILGHDEDEKASVPGGPCHLASIATWADQVRRRRGYGWTGALHYIGSTTDWRTVFIFMRAAKRRR
jgi:hypothetical protein